MAEFEYFMGNKRKRTWMTFPLLQSETCLSDRRKRAFAFLALAVLVLLIYSNTFNADWHFDDVHNILERDALHMTHISWSKIKQSFVNEKGKLDRPVACLSFSLNHLVGGLNVFGYHAVNISIHVAASFFLFLFLHLTLHMPGIRERHGSHAYAIALLAGVLWAVHPIQTQAVTYIVQRMASLAGLFYIMAMYFFAKARTADGRARSYAWFAACILSSLLAFGSKQNAFVLPVTLLLYDQLISGTAFWSQNRRKMTFGILVLVLAVLLGLTYYHFGHGHILNALDGYNKRVFTLTERLLTQPRILIFYLSLLIYPSPTRLSLVHDVTLSTSLFTPISTLFSIAFIIALIGGAVFTSKKTPLISFSILFFFLNHVIESTVFPLELIFEHRNYIPSMLFFLPIAMLIVNGLKYFSYKRSLRVLFAGFVVLFLIGTGNATYLRNVIWKYDESLWIDCMDKYPNLWLPYINLGKYYADNGQPEKAMEYFQRGLGKKSVSDLDILFYYKTYFNLGSIHLLQGREQEALDHLFKASTYGIRDANQHILMAAILIDQGRHQEAEARLIRALADEPRQVDSLSNLGLLYDKLRQTQEAIHMLSRALEKAPSHSPTLSRLGRIFLQEKQYGKAFVYLKRALKTNPGDMLNILYLALLYDLRKDSRKADEILEKLLKFSAPQGLHALVEDLSSRKRRPALISLNQQALSLLAHACERNAHRFSELEKSCLQARETLSGQTGVPSSQSPVM